MLAGDEFGDPVLVIRSETDHRPANEVQWEWRTARLPHEDEYVTAFVVCAIGAGRADGAHFRRQRTT